MKQFSLEKWLENPSRKVVTRDGRPVRIVCTDSPNPKCPIYGFVEGDTGITSWRSDGSFSNLMGSYDLFFADEELTEFEKELQTIISEASHWTSEDGSISTYCQFGDKEIKKISAQVLDLARKELELNYYTKVLDDRMVFKSGLHATDLQAAYDMGKQDVLKGLPKWKKATEHKEFEVHVCVMDEDMFPYLDTEVNEGEYYIELSDLKNLPKEK